MRDKPSPGSSQSVISAERAWDDRLLSSVENRAERHPEGSRVFDFHDFTSWREIAWEIGADFLDDRVRHAFRCDPPKYVTCDDLGWLDDAVRRATRQKVDSKRLMAERLLGRFDDLRCCHATNTIDVGTFYRKGLLPLDPRQAHDAARAILLDGRYPELSLKRVNAAIAGTGHGLRANRVFFEVNERSLVEDCGHYLLYGGEYLICIAATLGGLGRRDYRQALKGRGRPTVFVCDVPLAALGESILEAAGMVLRLIFEEVLEGDGYVPDPNRGFGFSIPNRLPPERIVGHYHPVRVRDPFTGGR